MSNELALVQTKNTPSAMTEVASSRQAQEVQAAMVIAQKFPRDINRSYSRIMEDCKRKSLAEKSVYSFPKGGQIVSGPSIRLAESIAKSWGNLDFGLIELESKTGVGTVPGESTFMAYCWDLETNVRSQKVFTVRHKRDTKRGSSNLTDERDVYELGANMGARRLRSCILSIIPGDITEAAVEACEKTMEGGQGPLIDRVRSMVVAFKDFGVTQDMIEKRLGHKLEVTTEAELVQLRKIFLSLKDNFADRSSFFEVSGESQGPAPAPIQDGKPQESTTQIKTIKNFAPASKEAAEKEAAEINARADQQALEKMAEGIQEQAPPQEEAPKKPTRQEIGGEIVTLARKLKIGSKEALDAKIHELTNKTIQQLTDAELVELRDVLEIQLAKAAN